MSKKLIKNSDIETIESFGQEWTYFDQSNMNKKEALDIFRSYFLLFPWKKLTKKSQGFDMGCGSGRWAKFVAPKVGLLNCIEPSMAIRVAKRKLRKFKNINFYKKTLDNTGLKPNSQDFGYSLGVLHHVPNTKLAIKSCVKLLKPGAPLLLYIYYAFDNRPFWFRYIWLISNYFRIIISRFPKFLKFLVCDMLALFVYFPLARISLIIEKMGLKTINFPLYFYRNKSFYVMRTDPRDRFGTPLEKRFTKKISIK